MEHYVFNDRYKIIAKIGAGGMADVYKAIDTVLDRPVAVKVLHRHFAEDQDFVSRFRREAQAAASLNHPNIVNIYDWGSQDGTYFIVMELLDGQSLKQYMNSKGIIPPAESMDIIKKVLSALNFAHKHDIIHRDVKPHNIILTSEGGVKVTDFGIARAGVSTMTQTGTIMGTAHYLSPEQARGRDVGVTSDVYSAGVVLYEMITGRVPFDGENPVAIALKHVHEVPIRPRELNPDVPEALQIIIAKSMAKNPESRYQSAAEMRNDVMRLMEGMPIVALPPNEQETILMAPPGKTTRTDHQVYNEPVKKRSSWPLVIVLMLLFGIAGATGGWFAYNSGVINMKKMVTVPNITNKSYDDAARMLENKKLKIKTASEAYSNTLNAGLVISQDPEPGDKKQEGSVVSVIVSKGQETKVIPDVSGDREYAATSRLIKSKFNVANSVYENSDQFEEGIVIRTEPPAGEELPVESNVDLIISKGPAVSMIPDVSGKPSGEGESILKEAGFVVTISESHSEEVSKSKVIKTIPTAGNETKKGTVVTMYVSLGPEMLTVPSVLNTLEDEAKNTLSDMGFSIEVEIIENVSPDNDSKVISQEPSAGTQVKKSNATVTIFVGKAYE